MEEQYSSSQMEDLLDELNLKQVLVLHNDEVNEFVYVVDTLVEVCDHGSLQAEQCTLITHYKGKCNVKYGSLTRLKPIKDELNRRGLQATIENSLS
ncbi:ATP-dependent Clp protease adaptor ClpS [Williamwhitmania taraxaci]|nr:ATP-dependent Clp protease adaptor ClpS [Williamwhitmania taraxaci]